MDVARKRRGTPGGTVGVHAEDLFTSSAGSLSVCCPKTMPVRKRATLRLNQAHRPVLRACHIRTWTAEPPNAVSPSVDQRIRTSSRRFWLLFLTSFMSYYIVRLRPQCGRATVVRSLSGCHDFGVSLLEGR